MPAPLKTVIVGCGAISEHYYAPALTEARKHTAFEVVGLLDPTASRLDTLLKLFPAARGMMQLDELLALKPGLAIVASPPKFHAGQTNALLAAGVHVLCEKPMATTVAEAESMIAAAKAANRVLAIGLFRRFFPALQTVKALVTDGHLGAPKSFHFAEGGAFNWPAASASFFQKTHAQGGVLLDLGVHVLDLVHWWFGTPSDVSYEDDAMGNLEANARVSLKFSGGLAGSVRLSRDTAMSNRYVIEFERGTVTWNVGEADQLDVQFTGTPFALNSQLRATNVPAATYHQSFVNQLLNVAAAARGEATPLVPGEEGIHSLRLIEQCYGSKSMMRMPWLSEGEVSATAAVKTI